MFVGVIWGEKGGVERVERIGDVRRGWEREKTKYLDQYMVDLKVRGNKEDTRLGERIITVGLIYFVELKVRGIILYRYCLIV